MVGGRTETAIINGGRMVGFDSWRRLLLSTREEEDGGWEEEKKSSLLLLSWMARIIYHAV